MSETFEETLEGHLITKLMHDPTSIIIQIEIDDKVSGIVLSIQDAREYVEEIQELIRRAENMPSSNSMTPQ